MGESARQEMLVEIALRRLGLERRTTPSTVRLLAGGLSGSSVFLLDLDGESAVLKLTLPGDCGQLMERAHREIRFYRELSSRVPLLVPRALGLDFNETEGATLLLAAYEPSPPPDQWTEQAYIQIAQQLGRFHATFCSESALAALPMWLRPKSHVALAQCRHAARQWQALSERADLHQVLEPYRRRLEGLVMRISEMDLQMVTIPPTLCHGDCHAGNVLRGPTGEWIWADWQEVSLGPGIDDLAFFWQRAFMAADTPPPYDAMVRAYRAGLEAITERLISPKQLERNLAWSELRSWLVDWPGYLRALSTERIARAMQRITTLIDHIKII